MNFYLCQSLECQGKPNEINIYFSFCLLSCGQKYVISSPLSTNLWKHKGGDYTTFCKILHVSIYVRAQSLCASSEFPLLFPSPCLACLLRGLPPTFRFGWNTQLGAWEVPDGPIDSPGLRSKLVPCEWTFTTEKQDLGKTITPHSLSPWLLHSPTRPSSP